MPANVDESPNEVASRRERRSRRPADEGTRERVIRAAIDCILDEGYYRASSNRIAKRAGLTWGVIQHHFGTRDQLLIEVMRSINDRQIAVLKESVIVGSSPAERVASYAGVVFEHFGSPEYLVATQILLNLSRDPIAAAETAETLGELSERLQQEWRPLIESALGTRLGRSKLGVSIGSSLRGLAIAQQLSKSYLPHGDHDPSPADETARRDLVRAWAELLEREQDRRAPRSR